MPNRKLLMRRDAFAALVHSTFETLHEAERSVEERFVSGLAVRTQHGTEMPLLLRNIYPLVGPFVVL